MTMSAQFVSLLVFSLSILCDAHMCMSTHMETFSSDRKVWQYRFGTFGSDVFWKYDLIFWFDKAAAGNLKRCLFVFRRTSLWGPLQQSGWCAWGEGQQRVLLMMQDVFVKPGSLERPGSGEDTARRRPTGTSYQEGNKAPSTATTSTTATPHLVV